MVKLYLAVGHGDRDDGGFDPGAVGGGWSEQTAGDHIVAEAARVLRAAGVSVIDEAFKDDPNFPGTVRAANAWGADYLVTVHHDWIGAPEGAFAHWYTAAGKVGGDHIQQAVGEAGFPLRGSWHKRRDDLYLLKRSNMPAVLYEVGKIGQSDLDTVDELKTMGRAVARGIARWVGVGLEEGDVAGEGTQDRVLEILGERDVRPSLWRDVDVTKQAVGGLVLAVQELRNEVRELRAVLDGQTGGAAVVTLDAVAVAETVVAEVARAIQSVAEELG